MTVDRSDFLPNFRAFTCSLGRSSTDPFFPPIRRRVGGEYARVPVMLCCGCEAGRQLSGSSELSVGGVEAAWG